MSFGSSLRFQATRAEDGRPKIFWEEARDVRPKKKFSYKKIDQKHPLRSKLPREANVEEVTEVREVRKAEPDVQRSEAPRAPVKMKRAAGARAQKPAPRVEAEPLLSLTEEQLAKMIESIGKVSKNPLRISIDKDTHQITLQEDDTNKENLSDESEKKKTKRKKKTSGKISKETTNVSTKSHTTQKTTSPREGAADDQDGDQGSAEPGHDKPEDEEKKDETEKPAEESPKPDAESTPITDTTPTAPRYLSLAERKRRQWEMEKAEEDAVYSPWGRPGAGAPIRTTEGDVLADYNSRKPQVVQEQILLVSPRSDASPAKSDSSPVKSDTSPVKSDTKSDHSPRRADPTPKSDHSPNQKKEPDAEMAIPGNVPDVPVAMRSSFAIGALAPDESRYQSKREMEKKKWLQELEQQIQEKKNRNQALVPVKEVTSPRQPEPAVVTAVRGDVTIRGDVTGETAGLSDVRASITQPDVENKVMVPMFVRGQNAMLDPQTLKEMEEKRRRHVEHQKAIQAQVEEKQRLKKAAEQRKLEEDLAEERRMQEERERLQRQFEQEQLRQRRKKEEQDSRVQRLKEIMDEAEYDAKQQKHMKRLQHLKEHGHDVTLYHRNFEAQHTPRHSMTHAPSVSHAPAAGPAPSATALVEPTYVPGLDLSARSTNYHDNAAAAPTTGYHSYQAVSNQTGRHGDGGYVENRTLTPSKLRRHTAMSEPELYSARKEFGTQTEIVQSVVQALTEPDVPATRKPRETSAGIEFDRAKLLDIKRSEKVKKVRVLSAKSAPSQGRMDSSKPPRTNTGNSNKTRKSALKWNQNPNVKKPMTQSEKDPNYNRKRQESLQRRQKRAQELQAMVQANQNVIPTRSRSRSRSMSPKQKETRTRSKSPEKSEPRRSRLESHEYDQWARTDRQQVLSPDRAGGPVKSPVEPRSPPVPAVRHRAPEPQPSQTHPDTLGDDRGHYSDHLPSYAPVEDGEFIPFLRSSAFLDPSDSMRPLPVSREPTMVEQGRKAYAQNQKPGVYGARMNHIHDTGLENLLPAGQTDKHKHVKKDPITQPNLVTDHPTSRQEMILQQLSDIRKNLLMKQREIETSLSPTDLRASRT